MFEKNKTHIKILHKQSLKKISLAAVLSVGAFVAYAQTASAANLASVSVSLDRMKASTATGGTVCATAASAGTVINVKVTFPTGFGVNTTAANWTTNVTGIPSGTTQWPSITTASGVSGQTVTFGSGSLTPGTQYCFNFSGTNTLTTSTSGASLVGSVTTSTGSDLDTGQYALAVIADDQILVTATVNPSFTFALSGNTDTFTTALSPTSIVSTSGKTISISTNSDSGWVAWVKSANAALASTSASTSIATIGSLNNAAQAFTVGSNGYGLDVTWTQHAAGATHGDGTVSQSANYGQEYDGTYTSSTNATAGTLSTIFQPIAASDGTTDGDTVTLTERATISAVTPAASDYTDTLTVIGAGRF